MLVNLFSYFFAKTSFWIISFTITQDTHTITHTHTHPHTHTHTPKHNITHTHHHTHTPTPTHTPKKALPLTLGSDFCFNVCPEIKCSFTSPIAPNSTYHSHFDNFYFERAIKISYLFRLNNSLATKEAALVKKRFILKMILFIKIIYLLLFFVQNFNLPFGW